MSQPHHSTGTVRCTVSSRPGSRNANEDAAALGGWALHSSGGQMLDTTLDFASGGPVRVAVADGMGGRPAGATAARLAVEALTRGTASHHDDAQRLRELFERADDAIRAAATPSTAGLGCAAAYVEIEPDGGVRVANVGDVRVYQSLRGYLATVTRDDRLAEGSGALLSRCLGGARRDDVRPHVFDLRVSAGDALYIVTDGVHGTLSDTELEAALDSSVPASVAKIADAAARAGTTDDATVLALEVIPTFARA